MILIAIGLAGAIFYLQFGRVEEHGDVQIAPAPEPKGPSASPNELSKRIPTPLPSQDRRLRLVIDDLRKRSASGDADASCLLAVELQRCTLVQKRIERADSENRVPAATLPVFGSNIGDDLEHCEAIEAASAAEVAKLWRTSAEQGSVTAMTNYGVGNGFLMDGLLDVTDELQIYKQKGPAFVRRAISEGDGRSLLSLAAAYSPSGQNMPRTLLAQAVGLNVYESMTLYKVAQIVLSNDPRASSELAPYVAEQIQQLHAISSVEQQAATDQEAARQAAHLRGMHFPPASLASMRRGRIAPIQPGECAPD